MVFDHRVNYNGKYYAAGEEVPMEQVKMPEPASFTAEVVPEVEENTKTEETPKRRRRTSRER